MDSLEGLRTKLIVEGGHRLEGVVAPPGAKNAALPIMAAAILCESEIVLHRVPRITDVDVMTAILESLGARVREQPGGTLVIDASSINSFVAPYALVSKLNASFDVTGALLGRFGRAEVPARADACSVRARWTCICAGSSCSARLSTWSTGPLWYDRPRCAATPSA